MTSTSPPSVVVVGSANLDVVLSVAAVPRAGETVLARGTSRNAGGKGLNQAVAVARAGAACTFVAAVGDDEAGRDLTRTMVGDGIDVTHLRTSAEPTGTAHIAVQDDGDNAIVVAAGANATLHELTAADRELLAAASVVVAQLEVPVEVVTAAAQAAADATVVLNAAPAAVLPPELLAAVDVLVVNEHEALVVAGLTAPAGADVAADPALLRRVLDALLEVVPAVVVTLGGRGARWATREASGETAAPRVHVVDTTGAGDTAVGYLAAALAAGEPLAAAVAHAVAAGSLAVETAGAVPSVPRRAQVLERLPR
ncbi:ribokinase [Kineococcus rubinsiae]|uniref:ribokinase n=1 Tax=Kineococcus rubinsiae TaxID=2609562 RepID=UPI0014306506|nr:ribokinase [Kineococcus rubinsiae]NIZ90496.1 ribokinase [Kineococcus rubinsiae]